MADKKPKSKRTYSLTPTAKKELRKQELGIKDKPIAEKSGTGLGDNTALLNKGLQNISFSNRTVDTTTFEPPATQQNVTQQPETTEQPQNNLLLYGQSGLPNSEVSTLLGSMLTSETQKNLYDNVSYSLNKMKEGAELFDSTPNVGLTPGNALAGIKFLNGLASLSFEPITVVNEVLNQNPVTKWLNKGAMLPFELADELYTLTQKGTDYAYEQITGNKPDRSDPLSQELDEFVRTSNQLLLGGKAFHETGKFFKKGMPEVKEVKTTTTDPFENKLNEQPEVTKPTEVDKKPYEQPATILGEEKKQSPAIELGNKKKTFTNIISEFDKDLQTIEKQLSSGEISKEQFSELEKQYNETESRKKTWQKRLEDLTEEPKPIGTVTENKRPNNDELYSEENIKNPQYPDRTNEPVEPIKTEEVIPETKPTETVPEAKTPEIKNEVPEKPIEPQKEVKAEPKKEDVAVGKVEGESAKPEQATKEYEYDWQIPKNEYTWSSKKVGTLKVQFPNEAQKVDFYFDGGQKLDKSTKLNFILETDDTPKNRDIIKKFNGKIKETTEADLVYFERQHKQKVQKALSEGKTVPEEVLKDYPELKTAKPESKLTPEKPTLSQKKEVRKKQLAEKKVVKMTEQEKKTEGALTDIFAYRERVNGLRRSDISGRANRRKNINALKKAVDEYNTYSPDKTAKIEKGKSGNYRITIEGARKVFDVNEEVKTVENPDAHKSFKELGAEERATQIAMAEDLSEVGTKFLKEKGKFETPAKVLKKGIEDIKDDSGKELSPEAIITRDEMLDKGNKADYKDKADEILNKADESDITKDADTSFNFGANEKKKVDDSDTKIKISQLEKRKKDLQDKLNSGELDKEGKYKTVEKTDTSEQPDFFGKSETQDLTTERDVNEVRKRETRKEIKIIDNEIKKLKETDYNNSKQIIKSALSKDSGISFGGLSKLGDISDPKVLKAVYDVGKYHIENGAVKLADFSKRMIAEVGAWIKPHLRSLWDELNKNRTGIDNIVTSGINTIKRIKDLPKEFKGVENTNEFKEWFRDSKVRDENGNPIQLYSGHSNVELYGEYNPKKSTAGGFYATENPEVASGYALSKFGSKEGFENGSQYRIKGKNGEYNKKLFQYELTENQKKIIDELKNEQNEYGDYDYHLKDMERYIEENSKHDADVRRWGYTGGIYNLRNIYEFNEQMGYNIAYDKQGKEPRFMRQQENDTELIMNRLGIDWNSYDWEKPGTFPVYLNIKNPIDADKPFPADLLKALEDKAKYERYRTEGELHYSTWTNDYPLREWVKDIKDDNEGWSTQIPKKALQIIKSFGYDGIKERGMKATGLSREERSINWIAFDKEQILNKFDYNYLKALKSLQEKINRPNMTFGLDTLPEVYTIAKYHTGKFVEWSKKVIADVGNWIKPHLRNLWNEISKDRTGLDNAVTQGFPLSFKKKSEIIKNNVEKPQTEVRDISEILPTTKNKRAILASDIFTKGDKEAGKDVFNYDNFTESTQINELIRETATENKKAVDEQKRDVRTWAKTQEGADMLRSIGLDENAFLKMSKGDSLLAERIMAGKDIVNIAGKQLLERIKTLPEGNDPKTALANDYLKYVALVKNLKGLVSESGRALNIARKKSNSDVQVKLDLADELIKAGFDTTSLPDFASKTLEIVEPTYKDKFYYWWYNSMLSNPLTDVANITGNLSHFGFELMRNVVSQNPKDSMQMLKDMRQAHTEGVKQVKDIIKNGETADSKFDYNERRYGEAFQPTSKTGKRFKAILPTTRLAFEDAYFRNMFGAIRKNATLKEISKETGDPVAKVENLIKAIAHNPDLVTLDKKFEIYQKHLNALEKYIDYGVFQTPLGEAGRNLQSGVNKLPPVKLIFPFIKIAVNIAKTGLRASPYGFKDLLKKDLTRLEKKDIISRAVTGSAFLAGLGYLISQDLIEVTGHGIDDKDKRELWHKQGYKENHFYMKTNGEKYGFSYQNINPINIPLSIIGNLQDDAKYNRKKKEFDDTTTTRIIKSLLGMAETLTDQSFMQGISNLMRYVRDKDVEGLYKNAQNLFTPNILSLPRDIKNMTGNGKTQYETNDIESRLKDKIGMTEGLKPKLNQFGEPMKSTYERFPFMVSKQKSDDKLTDFLAENNIEISFPSKQTKLGDQVLTDSPETYYKYNKLSGERFKEELTKQLPELEKLKTAEEKDDAVHKIVNDVRKQIRKEMLGLPEDDKKKTKKHLNIPGRPNPDKDSERNSENKQPIKKHLIIPK